MTGAADESTTPGETSEPRVGLLSRVSNAMVQVHKELFGKGPDRAKSYLLDDLLIVVMRGGVTVAEHTMVDAGQQETVRAFRQKFEDQLGDRFVAIVEELTGRNVAGHQSQIMFDPDVVLEIFLFDSSQPDSLDDDIRV